MVKSIVTISLIIFAVVVIGILGAGVFLSQPKTTNLSLNGATQNSNPSVNQIGGDEDNNPDDEEGEDGASVSKNTNPANTKPKTTPAANGSITSAELLKHSSSSNCWMMISGKVYDLTSYMRLHPGGAGTIIPFCGKDGTTAFDTKGGGGQHSQQAHDMLINYYVGNFGG